MKSAVETCQYTIMHIGVLLISVFAAQVVAKDVYVDSDAAAVIAHNYAKKKNISYAEAYQILKEDGVFKNRPGQQAANNQSTAKSTEPNSVPVAVVANALSAMGTHTEKEEAEKKSANASKIGQSVDAKSAAVSGVNASKASAGISASAKKVAPTSASGDTRTTASTSINGSETTAAALPKTAENTSNVKQSAGDTAIGTPTNEVKEQLATNSSIASNFSAAWQWLAGITALLFSVLMVTRIFRGKKQLPTPVAQSQNKRPHTQNIGLATLAVVHSDSNVSYYLPFEDSDNTVVDHEIKAAEPIVNVPALIEPLVSELLKPMIADTENPIVEDTDVKIKPKTSIAKRFSKMGHKPSNIIVSGQADTGNIYFNHSNFNSPHERLLKLLNLKDNQAAIEASNEEVVDEEKEAFVETPVFISKSGVGDQRLFNQSLVTPLSKLRAWIEKV